MSSYLYCAIPQLYRRKHWNLNFDISHDGVSYSTLFNNVKDSFPSLIVIEDTRSNVFGIYTPQALIDNNVFYGTGETFVFSFKVQFRIIVGYRIYKSL